MKILAKSALCENQLNARKNINENYIEIQLLKDFYNEVPILDEYVNTIINSELNIDIIHTPLNFGDDVETDTFWNEKERNVFIKTCELANIIGTKQKKDILVVVHSSMNFKNDILNESKIKPIDNTILNILSKYENISICIENIIPIVTDKHNCYGRNGFLNDNCLYVDYFINKYGFKGRIGTVLDTCHALISINLLKYCCIDITLEQYFKWNKDNIKLIHLATLKENGYGDGNHGTGFETEEDIKLLTEIVDLYYKYEYSCPITIEIKEDDYLNPSNLIKAKENLIKIIENKEIKL